MDQNSKIGNKVVVHLPTGWFSNRLHKNYTSLSCIFAAEGYIIFTKLSGVVRAVHD